MWRALIPTFVLAACAAPSAVQSPMVVAPAPIASPSPPPAAPTTSPERPVMHAGMKQRPLGDAAVPFASYLNAMHNRIHPEFADKELVAMDALPHRDPRSDIKLATRVELVVSADDGHLVKVSIVEASGVSAFDVAVLASIQRAQPFGRAPGAIASADGNVYVAWSFHRDPVYSCSTMHARPYLLGP